MSEGHTMEAKVAAPPVPKEAKQGADTRVPARWGWVDSEVWTERMLAALGNGVKGGKRKYLRSTWAVHP